jgi:dephospho-CoA kinase
MIIVGLTGSICCGKSTISKTFVDQGFFIVDADKIAHEIVKPGTQAWMDIYVAFGKQYFNTDDSINREELGELVFNDPKEMDKLNAIMKLYIEERISNSFEFFKTAGFPIIVYDAPLLIEFGHADLYRPLIVVSCDKGKQVERLMKRNNLTEAQAMARINCQLPTSEKIKYADHIIDTNGTIEESIKQTKLIIEKITKEIK